MSNNKQSMKPFIKNKKYFCEFYTTFKKGIEISPRLSFSYHKLKHNVITVEWLWFGFYLQIFNNKLNLNYLNEKNIISQTASTNTAKGYWVKDLKIQGGNNDKKQNS